MSLQEAFRSALGDGDVSRVTSLWANVFPNMPQPRTRAAATGMMHRARTEAESVPVAKRLYSHAWLAERGYPSGLPDPLRPPADQVVPRIVSAVGIAVKSMSSRSDRVEEAATVEAAMAAAAGDAIESGVTDDAEVTRAMWAARDAVLRLS